MEEVLKLIKDNSGKAKQNKTKFIIFSLFFFTVLNIFSKSYQQSHINPNPENTNIKKETSLEQSFEISGVVADFLDSPLEGVSVIISDLGIGTITDINGRYQIRAKKGDVVSFSYIGFKTRSFVIGNQKVINVTMEEDISVLDEIVLIGYGIEKKNKVSAAVSTIETKQIQENLQSGATFDRSLDGLVKGVLFKGGSGKLGEGASINIRGVTSPFTNSTNNPLYVVDGVPFFTSPGRRYNDADRFNPLETINPDDIESITVLKDASATAIWGSRGANGVIIVKTKQGLVGQPITVSITTQTTFAQPSNTLDYLNAKDYKDYTYKLSKNSYEFYKTNPKYGKDYLETGFESVGIKSEQDVFGDPNAKFELTYDPSLLKFYNSNTNWNKVVYRKPAYTNQLSASLTGGGEKSSYSMSVGYVNQEGLLKADELERYNARVNLFLNLNEKLKTGATVNFSQSGKKTGFSQALSDNLGSELLKFRPDLPVYDKNGNLTNMARLSEDFGGASHTYFINPLGATTKRLVGQENTTSVLGNIFVEYDITKKITFKAQYSTQLAFIDNNSFEDKKYSADGYTPGGTVKSTLEVGNFNIKNTIIDYTATYNNDFKKHSLEGMIGFSHNKEKTITNAYKYKGFKTALVAPQSSEETEIKERKTYESGLNSLFSRISYSYNNKYGATVNIRMDRSSKFGPDNRNAFFPSLSAFWNIDKEKFMKKTPFSELKLRVGWGNTGSTNLGNDFYFQQDYVTDSEKYRGKTTIGFLPMQTSLGNSALRWEKTTEYNFGLDFRLKKSALRGGLDLYHKTSTDVLSEEGAPLESGLSKMPFNSASLENKGIELSLGSNIISSRKILWSVDFNIARNVNKVLSITNIDPNRGLEIDSQIGFQVGREVNIIRGFIVDGIYKNQAEVDELNAIAKSRGYGFYDKELTSVGDYKFRDISGPDGKPDGRITLHDRVIIGSGQPDVFGGFNTRVRYKNFSIGANFSYSVGGKMARRTSLESLGTTLFSNIETYLGPKNRWSKTNQNAKYPRLIYRDPASNNRFSTANIFDASYLRLTSLRFAYNLPSSIIEDLNITQCTLFIRGTNLYTWTQFPGLDPQGTITSGGGSGSVVNSDSYPSARTFSLGATINF